MFAPQRSQSGPGLSINTGAANTLSVNNTQPASGSLFGAKPAGSSLFGATASAAPSAGTLFGTTATTSAGTSLFGATANAPSQAGTLFGGSAAAQPTQSTSLFGNTATTTQPSLFGNTTAAPATTSLFGSNPAAPSQQSTSLFGNTTAQPQQQSTSLFGNTVAQPQQTTGLFGNTQPKPATTSLFGNPMTQPAATTSLFGPPAQSQGTSLFGGTARQPQQSSAFGQSTQVAPAKSLFGASQNTQGGLQQSTLNPAQRTQRSVFSSSIGAYTAEQQAVPGVRIDLSQLRPTTRFNDLYEGVQKEIENIDTFISNQIKLAEECEALMPRISGQTATIPADVEICDRKLEALDRSLEADAAAIDDAKKLVRKDADAARLSFKAIAALRMPVHLQSSSIHRGSTTTSSASDDSTTTSNLLLYFGTQADDMSKKLDLMKEQLSEVESYLSTMESNQVAQIQSTRLSHGRDGGVKSAEAQIKEMAQALQSFEGGILSVASRITATREGLGGLIMGETHGRSRR